MSGAAGLAFVKGSGTLDELLAERFPRLLMLQTTSACNASCVFCPLPMLRKDLPQGRMSDELFSKIILEASRYPEVSCINLFLMNEPLCDRQIVERIYQTHMHNPRAEIALWTNAVALSPRLTDRLLGSPLTSMGVSLHAHRPETYRRVLGRKDFHRVMGNLVHFVEQRLARRPDLFFVLRYVGADHFMSPDEVQELEAFWVEGQITVDIDGGYLSRAGNLSAPGGVEAPYDWLSGCQAMGGPKQAHILYTGQVVFCCNDYRRQSNLGNVSEQSLQQVWTGEPRRLMLETIYGLRTPEPGFLCTCCELAVPGRKPHLTDQRQQPKRHPETTTLPFAPTSELG